MKDILLTIACVSVLLLAGCGHSGSFTASGKILQIGTPEFGATYVNGLMTVVGSRENTENIVEFSDDDGLTGGPTADMKSIRTIRYRTGIQLNGYAVDLAKKSPEAIVEYVKIMPELNTPPAWDTKESLPKKSAGEKSSSDNYIDYLKEKLKTIVGKDDSKTVINGDGEYKELYKDASIEAQAALTSELLSKCDNETLIQEDSQTIKETLVYYAGRLASLKAKGKAESKRVILNKATIKDGKVTFLRYRLCDAKTGEVEDDDEICPNCYGLED